VAATEQTNGAGHVFTATYYDTPDRRLTRAGISLRRRMENGVGMWEADIAGTIVAAAGGPVDVPEELAQRLRAPLHHAELVEIVRLRNGSDDVALLEGQRVVRTFPDLDTAVRKTVAPRTEPTPRKKAPTLEHVRAYLRRQVAELERTDPIVRVDQEDDEALHDLRVAIRRTRAILRATRELFDPDWVKSLRAELKWIGRELAPARDLDVLIAQLEQDTSSAADSAPILKALRAERRSADAKARKALESPRYLTLLDTLRRGVDAPPVRTIDVPLERVAAREFRRLRRRVAAVGKRPTPEALHRARIQAKRARYAAELAEPAAGKKARRFVAASKVFQDAVGAHQDAVVAEDWIRAAADRANTPAASFASGQLVERERVRRVKARKSVKPAWKKLQRRGRKAWA
jgi:CHAD domain-containing protein